MIVILFFDSSVHDLVFLLLKYRERISVINNLVWVKKSSKVASWMNCYLRIILLKNAKNKYSIQLGIELQIFNQA